MGRSHGRLAPPMEPGFLTRGRAYCRSATKRKGLLKGVFKGTFFKILIRSKDLYADIPPAIIIKIFLFFNDICLIKILIEQ